MGMTHGKRVGAPLAARWLGLACGVLCLHLGSTEQLITFLHWNDHHARVEPGAIDGGTCLGTLTTPQDLSLCFGGYARIATLYNQTLATQKASDVILLVGGDTFVGTTWDQVYKGNVSKLMLQSLNANNQLTMTLGNHEFDYGPEYLGRWSVQMGFDLLCANLNITTVNPELLTLRNNVKNFTTFTTSDGVFIGVVGWITPQAQNLTIVGPDITFSEILKTVQATIYQMQAQGIQRIIGLSHAGYDWDIIAAQQLIGIHLIVGGHSHTLLANKPYPVTIKNSRQRVPVKWKFQGLQNKVEKFEDHMEDNLDHLAGTIEKAVADVNKLLPGDKQKDVKDDDDHKSHLNKGTKYQYKVFNVTDADVVEGPYPTWVDSLVVPGKRVAVVQAYQFSKYVGRLYTYWEGSTLLRVSGGPVLLGGSSSGNPVAVDPFFQNTIDVLSPPVRAFQFQVLGTTETVLIGDRNVIRRRETNLGNAVCEALLLHGRTFALQRVTFAPTTPITIAFYNSGGIYASIPGPNITVDNVLTALPFGSVISILNVTGQGILAALENSVSGVSTASGRFLQVAGIRFGWSPSLPVGSRVQKVYMYAYGIGFQELDLDKQYAVLTNNFVASGYDGFSMLNQATSKGLSTTYYKFSIPASQAFMSYVSVSMSLNVSTDGRIANCEDNHDETLCGPAPACKEVMGVTFDKPYGCKPDGTGDDSTYKDGHKEKEDDGDHKGRYPDGDGWYYPTLPDHFNITAKHAPHDWADILNIPNIGPLSFNWTRLKGDVKPFPGMEHRLPFSFAKDGGENGDSADQARPTGQLDADPSHVEEGSAPLPSPQEATQRVAPLDPAEEGGEISMGQLKIIAEGEQASGPDPPVGGGEAMSRSLESAESIMPAVGGVPPSLAQPSQQTSQGAAIQPLVGDVALSVPTATASETSHQLSQSQSSPVEPPLTPARPPQQVVQGAAIPSLVGDVALSVPPATASKTSKQLSQSQGSPVGTPLTPAQPAQQVVQGAAIPSLVGDVALAVPPGTLSETSKQLSQSQKSAAEPAVGGSSPLASAGLTGITPALSATGTTPPVSATLTGITPSISPAGITPPVSAALTGITGEPAVQSQGGASMGNGVVVPPVAGALGDEAYAQALLLLRQNAGASTHGTPPT